MQRSGTLPPRTHAPVRFSRAGFAPTPVPYQEGLDLQQAAVDRIESGLDRGTVLLLEHEPVFTAGRRSLPEEYPTDGTPVVPVNRGGKVTWHGPGQLVAYPVIRLAAKLAVVDFVRALESTLINVAAHFGVTGGRIEGRAGVWHIPKAGSPAKFAQVGIHTSDGIVTHGIALNCSNSLEPFASFVPCGITDAAVTSLSALSGRDIDPLEAAPVLERQLAHMIEELAA